MTIYLYIKQHSLTKLKYFGRTESKDPISYNGSGIYWRNHIRKHGIEFIETVQLWEFSNQDECTAFALEFSKENNIVESDQWANLMPENGKRVTSEKLSQLSVNQKISETLKRKYESGELVAISGMKGKKLSDETKDKISNTWKEKTSQEGYVHHTKGQVAWNKDKELPYEVWNKDKKIGPNSKESNLKRSKTLKKRYETSHGNRKDQAPWNKGKTGVQEAWNKGKKTERVICPHCGKDSDVNNAKRWHFDRCKSLISPTDYVVRAVRGCESIGLNDRVHTEHSSDPTKRFLHSNA